MNLYQEIILLKKWHEGKWVVENVNPYYEPLIPGKLIDRHLFWSNFTIGNIEIEKNTRVALSGYKDYEREYGYDLSKYDFNGYDRRQKLRNCVHPELGLHILNRARGIIQKSNTKQMNLL